MIPHFMSNSLPTPAYKAQVSFRKKAPLRLKSKQPCHKGKFRSICQNEIKGNTDRNRCKFVDGDEMLLNLISKIQ